MLSDLPGMGWIRPHSCQCLDDELRVPHDGYPSHRDGWLLLRLDHRPCILPCLQPPHYQFELDQALNCHRLCCFLFPPCLSYGDRSFRLWLQYEGASLCIMLCFLYIRCEGQCCVWWSQLYILASMVFPAQVISVISHGLSELVINQEGWSTHFVRAGCSASGGLQCGSWDLRLPSHLLADRLARHLAFRHCAPSTSMVCYLLSVLLSITLKCTP